LREFRSAPAGPARAGHTSLLTSIEKELTMRAKSMAAVLALGLAVASVTQIAQANLASQPTALDPLILDDDLTFSVTEYELEVGKYYSWTIRHDGREEFMVRAPELFRNAWINHVVINDIEVKPMGGIYGIEFDDSGEAVVWFVPIRPGNYDYFVAGHEVRGMIGTFVVR
jgi:plastocyanin